MKVHIPPEVAYSKAKQAASLIPMEDKNQTLFLVDASSFIYRSFHAIQGLTRSDGFPTNAIHGFYQMIRSVLKQHQPVYFALIYDLPGPTFRHEQFEGYKAQRKETPEALIAQIPCIKRIADAYGLPSLEKAGFEADDIIGTLAVSAREKGFHCMILTNDKDMMQLVCPEINILHVHGQNSKVYDESAVRERYGVSPSQMSDLLGLMGDSSDNIPGVPGIGEKTGAALLTEYGNLESVLDHASEVKAKRARENLLQFREQALFSRKLATIVCNAELDAGVEDLKIRPMNVDAMREVLAEFELSAWLKELPKADKTASLSRDYITVNSEETLRDLTDSLKQSDGFAFDTETTSLDPLDASLVGMSFCVKPEKAWYVPAGHLEGKQLPMAQILDELRPLFEDPKLPKAGHNLKYDVQILKNVGLEVNGLDFDTLVAAYLVEGGEARKGLDELARQHFGREMTPIKDLIGKGRDAITMASVDISRVTDYACDDADVALMLRDHYAPLLLESGMSSLFRDVEMPLVQVLADMEREGVRVDCRVLAEQSEELGKMMESLAGDIFREAGAVFNLNSPKQLSEVLFDQLKLRKVSRRSTRADVLVTLAEEGSTVAKSLLEYRQLQKLKSTYLDSLPQLVKPTTGKIHTSFNQAVANTGRLSSSEPNLQNIPIRTDLGKRIRRAFIPTEGNKFLGADYSQIELRILAHLSGDPGLCDAFAKGVDIHVHTASEVFEVPASEVTDDLRRRAKEINFGLNYGMSPYGLADRLGISALEAAEYMERYFARYPRVRDYVDTTVESARRRGYVETIMARRIKTPNLLDDSRTVRDNAARAAINAPIQGSAADMLKIAMVRTARRLSDTRLRSRMILTIHDELIFDFPPEERGVLEELVREEMEGAMSLSVPIKVDVKVGENWAEI